MFFIGIVGAICIENSFMDFRANVNMGMLVFITILFNAIKLKLKLLFLCSSRCSNRNIFY